MSREGFAAELARIADEYDLRDGGRWSPSRVSAVLLNKKASLSVTDAAALIAVAVERGFKQFDWDWLVYGEEGKRPALRLPGVRHYEKPMAAVAKPKKAKRRGAAK